MMPMFRDADPGEKDRGGETGGAGLWDWHFRVVALVSLIVGCLDPAEPDFDLPESDARIEEPVVLRVTSDDERVRAVEFRADRELLLPGPPSRGMDPDSNPFLVVVRGDAYILADGHRTLIVYAAEGTPLSLDLSAGRGHAVEWFDSATGEGWPASPIEGGRVLEFEAAPFPGDAVLKLTRAGTGGGD